MKDFMTLYGQKLGSHYRGRVMYGGTSMFGNEPFTKCIPIEFQFPMNPIPQIGQKSYTLRVDLLEANELPIRAKGIFHMSMGPYLLKSEMFNKLDGGRMVLFDQMGGDKKVMFPCEIEDVPDLIVYFCDEDEEYRRHTFCRIAAKDILVSNQEQQPVKTRMVKLKEDRCLGLISDNESPGFIYANIQLFEVVPGPRIKLNKDKIQYQDMQLKVHLYMAKSLDPADEQGTSDPFI